jgi:transposase
MEACGGSNYWARELQGLGHTVKLMDARYVKPYVKGNKNDFNDAEALAEAVRRPTMRFVPIKTVAQQDIQAIHRVRAGLVRQRTAMGNQLRGLLGEYGIVIPVGVASVRRRISEILEDAENGLSTGMRKLVAELYQRLVDVDASIKQYNQRLESVQQQDEASNRLRAVVGFGPVIATALASALGDGTAFKNGRQVSAWLGLVPKQHSTGGKTVLLGISKRGDRYLRTLLIHGARSVVRYADNKDDRLSR